LSGGEELFFPLHGMIFAPLWAYFFIFFSLHIVKMAKSSGGNFPLPLRMLEKLIQGNFPLLPPPMFYAYVFFHISYILIPLPERRHLGIEVSLKDKRCDEN